MKGRLDVIGLLWRTGRYALETVPEEHRDHTLRSFTVRHCSHGLPDEILVRCGCGQTFIVPVREIARRLEEAMVSPAPDDLPEFDVILD